MNKNFKIFRRFSSFLKALFGIALKKLDTLSVVNILLLFGLFLFVVVDSLGTSLLALIYGVVGSIGQLFGKTIQPTVDITPFWQYAIFLGSGCLLCLLIVKKHLSGKLW